MRRDLVLKRALMEFAKRETQPNPPLGEAKGTWRCNCGEEITWTRDSIVVPKGWNAKKYAAQEREAFLRGLAVVVQEHQLTHARAA